MHKSGAKYYITNSIIYFNVIYHFSLENKRICVHMTLEILKRSFGIRVSSLLIITVLVLFDFPGESTERDRSCELFRTQLKGVLRAFFKPVTPALETFSFGVEG